MQNGPAKTSIVPLAVLVAFVGAVWYYVFPLVLVSQIDRNTTSSGTGSARLFPVDIGYKWGFIDGTGRVVVPPQFDDVGKFSEGLCPVRSRGETAYIDESGKIALRVEKPIYAENFSDGLAEAETAKALWGYIDRSGNFAIPAQFQRVTPFTEGVASVGKNLGEDWYTIDKKGTRLTITPPDAEFPGLVEFSEGLGECTLKTGLVGYIDLAGHWVIPPTFNLAGNFSEGLAYAKPLGKRARWGYINRQGRWEIEPRFLEAGPFSEGLAAVRVLSFSIPPSRVGFIDRSGRMIIAPVFHHAQPFCGGLAAVESGGKMGYVDKTGRIAVPLKFHLGRDFAGPLAYVNTIDNNGRYHPAYINKKGEVVWASPDVVHDE